MTVILLVVSITLPVVVITLPVVVLLVHYLHHVHLPGVTGAKPPVLLVAVAVILPLFVVKRTLFVLKIIVISSLFTVVCSGSIFPFKQL